MTEKREAQMVNINNISKITPSVAYRPISADRIISTLVDEEDRDYLIGKNVGVAYFNENRLPSDFLTIAHK